MSAWQIKTTLPRYYISTTWVKGIEQYETMVFRRRFNYKGKELKDWSEVECARTISEMEAIKDHCDMVKRYASSA